MERKDVIKALDLCTRDYADGFCPCNHCPMMEAGCDEYSDDDFLTIPRALIEEVYKLLDPGKSEFTHVKYLH